MRQEYAATQPRASVDAPSQVIVETSVRVFSRPRRAARRHSVPVASGTSTPKKKRYASTTTPPAPTPLLRPLPFSTDARLESHFRRRGACAALAPSGPPIRASDAARAEGGAADEERSGVGITYTGRPPRRAPLGRSISGPRTLLGSSASPMPSTLTQLRSSKHCLSLSTVEVSAERTGMRGS